MKLRLSLYLSAVLIANLVASPSFAIDSFPAAGVGRNPVLPGSALPGASNQADILVEQSTSGNIYGGGDMTAGDSGIVEGGVSVVVRDSSTVNGCIFGGVFGGVGHIGGSTVISITDSRVNYTGDSSPNSGWVMGGSFGDTSIDGGTTVSLKNSYVHQAVWGGNAGNGNIGGPVNVVLDNSQVGGHVMGGSNGTGTINGDVSVTLVNGSSTQEVAGGSDGGQISGSTYVTIDNSRVDQMVSGGGSNASISGNTHVTVRNGSTVAQISGGDSYGNSGVIAGNSYVDVSNSTVLHGVYGGGGAWGEGGGTIKGNTYVTMNNVTAANGEQVNWVSGGSWQGKVEGATHVTINGGNYNVVNGGGWGESAVGKGTGVVLNSGFVFNLIGGSYTDAYYPGKATIQGGTRVEMTGGKAQWVYGGGWGDAIEGGTSTVISGGSVVAGVFAGGAEPNAPTSISGGTSLVIKGAATVSNVYGGSWGGAVTGGSKVHIEGGTVTGNVFGGGQTGKGNLYGEIISVSASTIDSTNVTVSGGVVNGHVYAGGDGTGAVVAGNATVTLKGDSWNIAGNIYGGGYRGATVEGISSLVLDGVTRVFDKTIEGFDSIELTGKTVQTLETVSHYASQIDCVVVRDGGTILKGDFDGSGLKPGQISLNTGGYLDVNGASLDAQYDWLVQNGGAIINFQLPQNPIENLAANIAAASDTCVDVGTLAEGGAVTSAGGMVTISSSQTSATLGSINDGTGMGSSAQVRVDSSSSNNVIIARDTVFVAASGETTKFNGSTQVTAKSLEIAGESTKIINDGVLTAEVSVASGATLAGSGVFSHVTVDSLSRLVVGNSPGVQSFQTLNASGTLVFSIDGTTAASAGNTGWGSGTYSHLTADSLVLAEGVRFTLELSQVWLNGIGWGNTLEQCEFDLIQFNGTQPTQDQLLSLAANTDFVIVDANGQVLGTPRVDNVSYSIRNGDTLVFSADIQGIPEPATASLGALALAALVFRRRRAV